MSALNHMLSDVLDELYNKPRQVQLSDQNLRIGLLGNEFSRSRLFSVPIQSQFFKEWHYFNKHGIGNCSFRKDGNNFEMSIDVQQFNPEDISVKVIGDYVVIEARHEEREDKHGLISRQFTRRYKLIDCIDKDKMKSTLSSNGILTLSAPKKEIHAIEAIYVPIFQTNEPTLKAGKINNHDCKTENTED